MPSFDRKTNKKGRLLFLLQKNKNIKMTLPLDTLCLEVKIDKKTIYIF